MLEKEIKILEIDVQEIQNKLEFLGAEKTFEGYIHDIYYDYPTKQIDEEGRIFRVRKKGETHLYTIKKKRKKLKKEFEMNVKDEHEMPITDIESFTRVLEKYGMTKTREKKKHRISYRLGEVEFDIDDYGLFPPLLEIEGHSVSEIKAWIPKLGLQNHISKQFGSRSLFLHYGCDYINHES